MEGSGSNVGVSRVATEQTIEAEATRNILEKQQIRWAKRGDTTPSVLNVERLQFRNLTPLAVVAFDDGKPGQQITILGDGQTTVNHNAKIIRAGAASALLVAGTSYQFTMWEDRVWHESSSSGGGGGGGGGVTSFNTRAGAVVPVAGDYTPAFIGAVPSSHLTDADPHTQYVLDSEKGAAGGVAQLDGSSLVPKAQLGTGTPNATKFLRGDSSWQATAGGGSGTYVTQDDEVPPAVAGAPDDEFAAPGLAGAWTQVNWAGLTLSDVDTTFPGALFTRNHVNANLVRAIMKAIPAGDFTLFTQIELNVSNNNYTKFGFLIADGVAAGAGNQAVYGVGGIAGGLQFLTQVGNSYIAQTANIVGPFNLDTVGFNSYPKLGIRLRRVGTNYFIAFSFNGILWTDYAANPTFVPTHFGLFTKNETGVALCEVAFKYFRYLNTGTITNTTGGRALRSIV